MNSLLTAVKDYLDKVNPYLHKLDDELEADKEFMNAERVLLEAIKKAEQDNGNTL